MHTFQPLAVKHVKVAHITRNNGDAKAWITSANFTDSDFTNPNQETGVGMNNLAIRVENNLAKFTIRAVGNGFGHNSGTHRYSNEGVTIVHDINNSGEPARLPSILQKH